MKQQIPALLILSAMAIACDGPATATSQTDDALRFPPVTRLDLTCLYPNAISTNDPSMLMPDGCTHLAQGLEAGEPCGFADQCYTGLCVAAPNGSGVCAKPAETQAACESTFGPGWGAVFLTIDDTPNLYEVCSPIQDPVPGCSGSCYYGETCTTNGDCASDACVKKHGSPIGLCGRTVIDGCWGRVGHTVAQDGSTYCHPVMCQ